MLKYVQNSRQCKRVDKIQRQLDKLETVAHAYINLEKTEGAKLSNQTYILFVRMGKHSLAVCI